MRLAPTLGVAIVACLVIAVSLKAPKRRFINDSSVQQTTSSQGDSEASAADYLPLAVGKKWVLRNVRAGLIITLTVEGVRDGVATVSFENPWFNSKLLFRQNSAQVQLVALEVKSLQMPMPAGTVYFDFGAPVGRPWQNSIGSIEVVAIHKQVDRYSNCIQIQETNKQGHKNLWSFAKGIGFVQFGEGKDAFLLDEAKSDLGGGPSESSSKGASSEVAADDSISPHTIRDGWRGTRVALAYNPFANELLTPFTVNAHFKQAVDAGVNYVYLSPKWEQLEPSARRYNFNDLDFQVGQAEKAGLPTILNIRVIDTGARPIPPDLRNKSFDDPEMIDRITALIDAVTPHLKGHVAYLLIGNEIDAYFAAHPNEVSQFATLFGAAKAHAQAQWQGIATSTTVTFGALDKVSKELLPVTRQTDFFSVTYYPLTPDFIVKDPSQIPADVDAIVRAAKGKKILFQEVGYPSSENNNSSQPKQAEAFSILLDTLAMHKPQLIGVSFLFMSDFSDSVTKSLAEAYNLGSAGRFSSYLQSLGMFDKTGNPKKSWAVFKSKVPMLTSNN